MFQVLSTLNGGLPSMTAKTKPSHSPINKSGFRKGTVVPTWTLLLVLVKVHGNQFPYHTVTTALNKTFHISQISPLAVASPHQDAAVIAAEVSAATAAQASKEFCHMNKPKITKLKGGYSTDAELVFHHAMQILRLILGIVISITLQPFS